MEGPAGTGAEVAALDRRIAETLEFYRMNGPPFLEFVRARQSGNPEYSFLFNGPGSGQFRRGVEAIDRASVGVPPRAPAAAADPRAWAPPGAHRGSGAPTGAPPPLPADVAEGWRLVLASLHPSRDRVETARGWFLACAACAEGMAEELATEAERSARAAAGDATAAVAAAAATAAATRATGALWLLCALASPGAGDPRAVAAARPRVARAATALVELAASRRAEAWLPPAVAVVLADVEPLGLLDSATTAWLRGREGGSRGGGAAARDASAAVGGPPRPDRVSEAEVGAEADVKAPPSAEVGPPGVEDGCAFPAGLLAELVASRLDGAGAYAPLPLDVVEEAIRKDRAGDPTEEELGGAGAWEAGSDAMGRSAAGEGGGGGVLPDSDPPLDDPYIASRLRALRAQLDAYVPGDVYADVYASLAEGRLGGAEGGAGRGGGGGEAGEGAPPHGRRGPSGWRANARQPAEPLDDGSAPAGAPRTAGLGFAEAGAAAAGAPDDLGAAAVAFRAQLSEGYHASIRAWKKTRWRP